MRVLIAMVLGIASLIAIPNEPVAAAIAPAVSGVMYRDLNANDVRDAGEPTLDGVTVQLRDTTTGLVVAGPVVTAADGSYVFEALPPGDYRVEADAPQNYLVSAAGADNAFVPIGDQTTGQTATLTIGPTDDLVADGLIRPRPELSVGFFAVGSEDGSNPFDVFGGCTSPTDAQIDGEDCGSDNGVVRSSDPLNVSVSVTADNYEPGAPDLQNVIYEQTIIPGPGASMKFERIPAICSLPTGGSNPLSSITNNSDGSITLLCNLGDIAEGAATTFTTSIIPGNESENGSTFEVTQRVYSLDDNGVENAVPDELDSAFPEFTVSSRPSFDVKKDNFKQRNVRTYTINGEQLTGYQTYFTFGISADRAVGVEQLEQPITINDLITAVGPDGVTPVPNFEFYLIQCIPNPTGWGETVYGRENQGGSQPLSRKVIDSGTCAYNRANPADLDSPYELTLNGIDMSGDRYPTSTVGGTDLSAGPFYVAYYRVMVFVPFRVIDPADGDPNNGVGAIQLSNELSDFDPDSPSGTSNYGDGFEPGYNGALMEDGTRSNNIIGPSTFELRVAGSWAKYIRGGVNDARGINNPLGSGQSSSHSGDGEIEPGQQFHSLIPYTNNGTSPQTDPQVCDTFDNSTMVLANNSFDGGYAYVGGYSLVSSNDPTWPGNWIVEYASIDYSPDNPLDGTGDGVPDYNPTSGRYDGSWDTQRAARCSDVPASDWQLDPNNVPGGIDAVNVVRVRAVDPARGLLEGEQVRTVVPLEARETFFGGPNDGEFIPTGTVLANFGAVRSDQWQAGWTVRNYRPAPETTNGDGDRLTLTRAQIRLEKHTLNPPTNVGETGSTLAGSQIVWELLPTASAATPTAVVTGVTVTDVLPPELTYNPDCTTAQGGTLAGQVLFDTPGPGETTLIWNLGDIPVSTPIDPIVYCTDSDPLAPNGTSVTNAAVMNSTNTVSAPSQRSDDHTIVLEQVGSIQVSKSVDLTLDDTDDDQQYTLGFGNYSANFTIGAPTLIDVLPYNGDGTFGNPNFRDPASDFAGTLELTGPPSVTWFDGSVPTAADPNPELGTFSYTITAPETITLDPDADAAANTTVWCSYDSVSGTFTQVSGPASSACPAAFADVTAFKFVSNYDLEIDGDPRQGMFIDTGLQALNNEPGDIYTNRFGLDSASLPAAQFLRSNNVTVRVASYSIGDFIFVDADGDGAYDPTIDVPVPDGVPVELRRPDGTLIDTTTTTVLANGRYLFDQLGSGDYIITIPASAFQAGGVLEGWVVTPIAGAEIDDENESVDQHAITLGSEPVDGVTTGTLTLSAIPPGPGEVPIGEEPVGENVAGLPDPTLDAFSNLTLDLGLIGPPDVEILKEVCSTGSTCDPTAAVGAGGWVKTTEVPFNDNATYRITVTNTGWQNLVDLEVSDPSVSDCDRTSATEAGLAALSPNQSVSWTCTQSNITNDLLNTATVNGEGLLGDPVTASDSAEVETPLSDPDIAVEKQVEADDADTTPGVFVEVGASVDFTFAVTNPGTVPLENVELVDDSGTAGDPSDDVTMTIADLVSGDTDGDNRLDPDETWLFGPITSTVPSGQFTNWATATGDPTNGEPEVTDSDPANVFGSDGGITIIKFVNGADADTAPGIYVPVGDPLGWTYEVTNPGNIALDNVAVSDDNGTAATGDDVSASYVSGDDNNDGLLDTNETWLFELAGTATSGPYVNIGTATGTAPGVATPFTADNPANHVGIAPGIDIEKSTNTIDADTPTGPVIPVGDTVTWTYVVTNTGDIPLADVTVVDDAGTPANLADDVTLTAAAATGDTNGNGLLDVTETWTFEVNDSATAGPYTNLATVTGDAPPTTNADGSTTTGEEVTDVDASNYLGSDPAIVIVKRVNNRDANLAPGVLIQTGDAQVWTYEVTNPGSVPLSGVTVTDDAGTPGVPADDISAAFVSGDANGDSLLNPGETWTFTASGIQPVDLYTNIADVSGTAPDTTNPDGTTTPGVNVSDDDPANSFGVTGGIDVVKTVNGQDANTAPGALVEAGGPVTWTYTVTNTGNVSLTDVSIVDDAGTPADATDDVTLLLADLVSGDDDGDGELDLLETWIFESAGTAATGPYLNTADATGTTPPSIAPDGTTTPGVDVTDDDPANSYGIDPGVAIVKTVNGDDANTAPGIYQPTGDPVTWTFTVTNTGNIALADITVVDDSGTPVDATDDVTLTVADLVSGDDNGDDLLDLGETWVFEITGTQADEGYRNLGDVTGTAPATINPDGSTAPGADVTDDDPANSFGTDPGITVVKTVNGDDANTAPGPIIPTGSLVEWTFTVTNSGNIALANVNVVDDSGTPAPGDDVTLTVADLVSGDANGDDLLDVGETWVFTIAGIAVDGPYRNVGEASGDAPATTNPDGTTTPGVTVTDDDPANHVGSTPSLAVEKTTNTVDADTTPGVYIPTGDPVTWTYTVTNTGTVPLSGVQVVDDAGTTTDPSDDVTLTVTDLVSGDTNGDDLLDLNETWVFELTGAATVGPYTNEADAQGTAPDTTNPDGTTTPGVDVNAQDPSNYTGSTPEIAVEKLVNGEDADTTSTIVFVPANAPTTWTFVVTNPGSVPLADVTVVDDLGTSSDATDDVTLTVTDVVSGDTNGNGLLDIDETWTFTLTRNHVDGLFENNAEATGTAPDTTNPDGTTTPGVDVTDSNPAVSYGTDPEIAIEKFTNDVDADTAPGIYQPTGAPITWTYEVTNLGNIALNPVTVVDDAGTPADPSDDVTLTITDLVSGDTDGDTSLDTDETWIFEVTGTATVDQYTNNAVATGTSVPTSNTDGSTTPGVDVTDDDPSNHFGTEPSIAIVKTVNGDDANTAPGIDVQSGAAVVWEYTVTNTGNIAVGDVIVVDDMGTPADVTDDVTLTVLDLVSGDTNGDTLLDTGETWIFEVVGTATPGPYVNEAEATATAPETTNPDGSTTPGVEVTDDDVANHLGSDAGVEIVKTVNGDDANTAPGIFIADGDPIVWTYTVTNPGTVVLSDLALIDDAGTPADTSDDTTLTATDLVSGDTNGDELLDLDETWVFELTGTATTGPYENIADVTANAPDTIASDGSTVPGVQVTGDDPANHTGWTTGVEITKAVNGEDANTTPGPLVPIGDDVTWTYTVTNTGSTWLTDVTVSDDQGVTVTCPSSVLAPAGDTTGRDTIICTGGPEAAIAGQYTNVGTITGTPVVPNPAIDPVDFDPTDPTHTIPVTDPVSGDPITAPSADDPANHYGTGPAIEIVKQVCVDGTTCDIANDAHWADEGELATGAAATWRISVNNIGNIELSDVTVADPLVPSCARTIGDLAAGASSVYSCSEPVIGLLDEAFVNTASVTATDPTGDEVDDSDTATVTSPGSFTIDKRLASSAGSAARVGDLVEFELVVTNDGMRTLTDLVVTDTPPTQLKPVLEQLGGGVIEGGTVVWRLDDLAPGETVTIRYLMQVLAPGQLTNEVTVASDTQLVPEDDPSDNADTAVLTATPRTGTIAFTGAGTGRLLLVALSLIGGGLVLVGPIRRRRFADS